jgi:carboxypeptidase Taq
MSRNRGCKKIWLGEALAFGKSILSSLQKHFPKQLESVDAMAFYRGVNKVKPSFIRVEADELSYNLHILLRFELEQEMLAGKLDAHPFTRSLERQNA